MAKKVSFSGENKSLEQTFLYYKDMSESLRLFFSEASPFYESKFLGFKIAEVNEQLAERFEELDLSTTMIILASVEAAFRIDYLKRCYQKKTDGLSRKFRAVYAEKNERASLEDDILELWKENTDAAGLIGDLRGAFRFRHWLAHGRYWAPKLGRKYDLTYVTQLAISALNLPLKT